MSGEAYGAGRGYGPGEGELADYVEASNAAGSILNVESTSVIPMVVVDGVPLPAYIANALLEQQGKMVG